MIRLSNLKLPVGGTQEQLKANAMRQLKLTPADLLEFSIVRQSIDARRRGEVQYVYTVQIATRDDEAVAARNPSATLYTPEPYQLPKATRKSEVTPVVVGMGPAGLFAALTMARAGVAPIILERGRAVEERAADVERFWKTGVLTVSSNVQFGEGGAGTFSDGKLSTGIHDPRTTAVLENFAMFGAPEEIKYSNKPHIGTDILRDVVKKMRLELIALGCEIRFGHRLTGVQTKNGALAAITVTTETGPYDLPCDALVLAPGHSARDTFQMLYDAGVPLEAKGFALGLRIEHLQSELSRSQYGAGWEALPPSDYKLACHLSNGRSAFSFCVCPGGETVAAASEVGGVVTNGMSASRRSGKNCNGGFLVGVNPFDFGCTNPKRFPLRGIEFQRIWERKAAQLGGGKFFAPAQTVSEFLGRAAVETTIKPTYRPGVTEAELAKCLPSFVTETLRVALPVFDGKLHGFASPSALLTGVETRSSSPVRILRGENFQSAIAGIYPCGEGAGYAGGITSSAVDGIKAAEAVVTGA